MPYSVVCFSSLLTIGLFAGSPLLAHGQDVSGFVNRVASAQDFSVDGATIAVTPATVYFTRDGRGKLTPAPAPTPFLGEFASVYGKFKEHRGTLFAKKIVFYAPVDEPVNETAIIDRVLANDAQRRVIRADGRMINVSAADFNAKSKAKPGEGAPADISSDLRTNVWIEYQGTQRPDGTVALSSAEFFDNAVDPGEAKLLARKDTTSGVGSHLQKQPAGELFSIGEGKSVPAYHDAAEQARIERIGMNLVPEYQKSLPASDPTKINFRFQLVDGKHRVDAMTLASGTILVPREIVERLPDDSQLAALLADHIAGAIEKEAYRQRAIRRKVTGLEIAGAAANAALPFSLATGLAGSVVSMTAGGARNGVQAQAEEQSGRVSLGLMHDAGYDITQAPEAWWTLATRPGNSSHQHSAPDRANNLYYALGTTWRLTLNSQGGVRTAALQ
jgi:hypothetical protein